MTERMKERCLGEEALPSDYAMIERMKQVDTGKGGKLVPCRVGPPYCSQICLYMVSAVVNDIRLLEYNTRRFEDNWFVPTEVQIILCRRLKYWQFTALGIAVISMWSLRIEGPCSQAASSSLDPSIELQHSPFHL